MRELVTVLGEGQKTQGTVGARKQQARAMEDREKDAAKEGCKSEQKGKREKTEGKSEEGRRARRRRVRRTRPGTLGPSKGRRCFEKRESQRRCLRGDGRGPEHRSLAPLEDAQLLACSRDRGRGGGCIDIDVGSSIRLRSRSRLSPRLLL